LTAVTNTSFLTCQENRFVDNSPNNSAITRNGDVSIKSFNPFLTPSAVAVNNFYSTNFDGSGDYLTVPYNSALNLGSSTTWTMEYWVYFNAVSGTYTPISFVQTGDIRWGIEHAAASTSLLFNNATAVTFAHPSTLTSNIWYHIAWVRNGTNVRLYINGVGSSTASTNNLQSISSGPLNIGYNAVGGYEFYMNGSISNLRIVKGTALYTGDFTPSTTPLTAITNTSLLTCQSPTLIDNSTNAFALTSAGQAQPIPVSPFTQTTTSVSTTYLGSSYFDGSGDYLTIPASSNVTLGTNNHTIECWYYATGSQQSGMTLWAYASGSTNQATNSYYLSIGNGSGNLLLGNGAGGWGINIAFTSPSQSAWHHVAVVRSGNVFTLYVDGVSVGTGTYAANITSQVSFPFEIGGQITGSGTLGSTALLGYVTNFRIVNGTALYTSNFAPPVQPLTAVSNTQLLTLQNNQPHNNSTFLDSSSNKFLITRNGNSTQGAFSPYGGNWSVYAPATGSYLTTSNSIFNISSTTAVWTYESWVMPLTNNTFFCIGSGGSYGNSIYIGWSTNKFNVGAGSAAGSNPVTFETTNTYPAGAWYHVAVTRTSAGVYTLYINGVADGTQTYNAGGLAGGTTVVINGVYDNNGFGNSGGSFYNSNMRFLVGTVLYTGNFTVPTAPLTAIANTALLTCADNRFIDDSPNNFTLTRAGDIVPQRFSPFGPIITTPISYSAYFDGNGDYLTPASSSEYAFTTGDFTVECWVYIPSLPGGEVGFVSTFNTGGGQGFILGLGAGGNAGKLHIGLGNGTGSGNFDLYDSVNLAVNTWIHVAAVRSSGTVTLYKNGVSVGSGSGTNNIERTLLGISISYPNSPQGYITGYISNVRIVKGTAVYTSTFTPSTTPLTAVAGTSLLTCQSPTFIDNSTNAFAITANGDSRPTTVNPFGVTNTSSKYSTTTFGGSAYFDGSGDYLEAASNAAFALPGDFTYECWFNSDNTGTGSMFMEIPVNNGLQLYYNGSQLYVSAYAVTSLITYTYTMPISTWVHIALVRSGTASNNLVLYINGVSVATASYNSSFPQGAFRIGGTSYYFKGYISNCRLVKGTAVYTSNFAPPIAPVTAVANTQLLCNFTNAGIIDNAMMVNLESFGDVKITTANSRVGGSAMYFDGNGDYLTAPSTAVFAFGTGAYTIEAWVYVTSRSTEASIWATGAQNNNFLITTGGLVRLYNGTSYTGTTVIALNTWAHVAVVRTSTATNGAQLFVNGVSDLVFTDTTNQTSATTGIIGVNNPASNQYFPGYIDDLRVTKGYARYTGNFTPINSSHPLR
jgi:hypothetical protein